MNQYKTSKDSEFILFFIAAFVSYFVGKVVLPVLIAALEWLMQALQAMGAG